MTNIYLTGYRCSGKTRVGKLLAKRLGLPFADTDLILEKNESKSVADIISESGWEAFRAMERDAVRKLTQKKGLVAATGGGAILDDKNVSDMKKSGRLIWLKASPETVKKRMKNDKRTKELRPSLTGVGALSEAEDIIEKRNPLYRKARDISVETDGADAEEVADTILKRLRNL